MTECARVPIVVLGIGEEGLAGLRQQDRARLELADLVCGGTRHLEMLPHEPRETMIVESPLDAVFGRIGEAVNRGRQVVVLASGDPCCFGIGPLLVDRFGLERVEIVPSPGAVQLAFARVGEPWQDARIVSAHGRPLEGVIGPVLAARRSAVLTDGVNTPAVIARALRECGLEDCRAVVGERLGGAGERLRDSTLAEVAEREFDPLNVLLLLRSADARLLAPRIGLPDPTYAHRDGMITKAEVRAVSLSLLAIQPGDVVWDIGAGCGSVSLEAASFVGHGFVYAVERDSRQIEFLRQNLQTLSGPVRIVAGEAPDALESLPAPDAVFLGGSGGKLEETLDVVLDRLRPNGRMVANFVVLDHLLACQEKLRSAGWEAAITQVSVSRGGSLGRLEALNPVFVLTAQRPEGTS